MTLSEPLDAVTSYVAPPGGVLVPRSGPVDDVYARGHYALPPVSIRDGCPAPLLDDEVVLGHWFVPSGKRFPTEVIGSYAVEDAQRRGPVARSSWYLLLTSRHVRVVAALARDASVRTDAGWTTPEPGGWIAFAFDLRTVTYFLGSRRRVEIGGLHDGFVGTAFMAAEPAERGWATPSTTSRTADFALDLGRAILSAKRDSGDADQEGAADEHLRSDWEQRVVGRLRKAELVFPRPAP